MTTHLHYNSVVSVELKAEDPIEKAYIALMLESAAKGRTVTLSEGQDGAMLVTVPK